MRRRGVRRAAAGLLLGAPALDELRVISRLRDSRRDAARGSSEAGAAFSRPRLFEGADCGVDRELQLGVRARLIAAALLRRALALTCMSTAIARLLGSRKAAGELGASPRPKRLRGPPVCFPMWDGPEQRPIHKRTSGAPERSEALARQATPRTRLLHRVADTVVCGAYER